MARDSRFKRFTAKPGEGAPDGTPDSEVYARVSEGDESVRTLEGERSLSKGDVVIERDENSGTYDVLSADQWSGLDWKGESSSSSSSGSTRKTSASKTTASKRTSARR